MAMSRECRQLLLELRSVALWTFGRLSTKDNRFKLVAALGTEIFENRHNLSQLRFPLPHGTPAIMEEDDESPPL